MGTAGHYHALDPFHQLGHIRGDTLQVKHTVTTDRCKKQKMDMMGIAGILSEKEGQESTGGEGLR